MSTEPTPPTGQDSALEQARRKLRGPEPEDRHWAALAAAAFFAICAILFAVAAVLAPPLSQSPAAKSGVK
jgi:hypothetical protein